MAVKKKKTLIAAAKRPAKAPSNGGESLAQVEGIAMNVAGAFQVEQFKTWLSAYFHPYQAYGKEKKNSGAGSAAGTFALIGLVQAVVAIIVMALVLALTLPVVGVPFTIVGAIMMLIAYPIASVIGGVLGSVVYFIMAKIVGGKGSFWEQTYCMALVNGGVVLMMLPFNVLQIIPLLGWIFSLLGLAVALYGIISHYRMIRAVHELSQLRAILVLIVPTIVIIAFIIFIVGVATIAALGAYGATLPVQ